MIEAQVVLANSTIVTASVTENPDLFWAIRGAGASYGIITKYRFQTYPAPTLNINFLYNLDLNQTQMRDAYLALQNYSSTSMPAEMNMRLLINGYQIQLMGVYYGTEEEFETAIEPILSKVGNPEGQVSQKDYLDTLKNYAYGSLTQPLDYDSVRFPHFPIPYSAYTFANYDLIA